MFTLSNGHIYGAALEDLTNPETERLARKTVNVAGCTMLMRRALKVEMCIRQKR